MQHQSAWLARFAAYEEQQQRYAEQSGAEAVGASRAIHTAAPFADAEAAQVITKLAETLERDFVMPEAGRAYAAMLRSKLASGDYSDFNDAAAFAAAVTADLQAVHKDRHLRLMAPKLNSSGQRKSATSFPTETTILVKGWLAPGVAYVSFSAFYGNDATMKELASFLEKIRGAKLWSSISANIAAGVWRR